MRVRFIAPTIEAVPGRVVVEGDKGNELLRVQRYCDGWRMSGLIVEEVLDDPFGSVALAADTEAGAMSEARGWAAGRLRTMADEMSAKVDEFRAVADQLLKCGVPA